MRSGGSGGSGGSDAREHAIEARELTRTFGRFTAVDRITFDESVPTDTQTCCPYRSSGGGGHVGLWVIGPRTKVRQGGYKWSGYANLYWLFKTIEENWSFARLGHSADSGVGDLAPLLISQ